MLTIDAIEKRRAAYSDPQTVAFAVKGLYGLSEAGMPLPLASSEIVDSGPISITLDPDADQSGNLGIIDYRTRKLTVRYAVQAVFPGLHRLLMCHSYDAALLAPVRVVATDDCTLTEDGGGWHALGCLDFLQGSVWSGATGG